MVKTHIIEKIIILFSIILELISIAAMIYGLYLIIDNGYQTGIFLLLLFGIIFTIFNTMNLLFFIKKFKCNKIDGIMYGYKCYTNDLQK